MPELKTIRLVPKLDIDFGTFRQYFTAEKIRGMTDFSDQFRKIIMRYKRIGYNLNVMRQFA